MSDDVARQIVPSCTRGAGWPLRGPSDTKWGQAARDGTVMRTVSSSSSDGV